MSQERILVVDDNAVNKDIAILLLEKAHYRTLSANTAEEGLQLAQTQLPHLVLMDLHLPGKDGYSATSELKQIPSTAHIPVIAFTALNTEADKEKALLVGCSGVIEKPIDIHTFAQSIAAFLNGAPNAKQSHEMTLPTSTAYTNEQRQVQQLLHEIKNYLAGESTVLSILSSQRVSGLNEKHWELLEEVLQANTEVQQKIACWRKTYFKTD